jgi:hypothetical protein
MYKPGELEIVFGRALARWASENGYSSPLPPVWLREMAEMTSTYYARLVDAGKFEVDAFEEDVYRLVCCFAVTFLKQAC